MIGSAILGEAADDQIGESMVLSKDGSTVIIGTTVPDTFTGKVQVFKRNSTNNVWVQVGQDFYGDAERDYLGFYSGLSISNDGETIAIGSLGNDDNGSDTGKVKIYKINNSNDTWEQLGQDFNGDVTGDSLGNSVSLSGDGTIVAIGIYGSDGNGENAGQVKIYELNSNNNIWEQLGQTINGDAAGDWLGWNVKLSNDGKSVLTSSMLNDFTGKVKVFKLNNTNNVWEQLGQTINGDAASGDFLGWSNDISNDGETIAIGAKWNDDNGDNAGQLKVFKLNSSNDTWEKLGQDIKGDAGGDLLGYSVSLSGNGTIVAIGVYGASLAKVFQINNDNDIWEQLGDDISDGTWEGSGTSVSISDNGSTVAVGSRYHSSNLTNQGKVEVYSLCSDSTIRLKIYDGDKKRSRYCTWVARKDKATRCSMPGVAASCPSTCNTCTSCADPSSEIKFRFTYGGKKVNRNCNWVGKVPEKVLERCDATGNVCRATCGIC